MTGPQHVKLAESFLADARNDQNRDDRRDHIAMAQVHATLALVAATMSGAGSLGFEDWWEAFSDQRWEPDD